MFNNDYGFIREDFLSAHDGTSSDNRYVLRKMLVRGSSEAMYRSRINEGDRAFDYKRMMYAIDDILEDLDSMVDRNGKIRPQHRSIIIEALKDCQCLLAIDQAETNADYNNLIACLSDDHCLECHESAVAA